MRRAAPVVLLAAALALGQGDSVAPDAAAIESLPGDKADALRADMRRLWADGVYWMRDYIKDSVARHPERRAVSGRLLRAQDDIGEAYGAYFGPEEGRRLAALLREHVNLAGELILFARRKDAARLKETDERWRDNARRIADFLSDANPYWERERVRAMLDERVTSTMREAMAQIEKDWAADIPASEQSFAQAQRLADLLTDGIVDRFPERF